MNKLSRILQLAQLYCDKAMQAYVISKYAAPEDRYSQYDDYTGDEEEQENPPYFDDLVDIAHKVDDPGLAQQLQVLAELYRKSVSMGGGYGAIAQAITNLKNMYSDGKESDIEFILNDITGELSRLAGGPAALAAPINPRFLQQLQDLKADIESRTREEMSEIEQTYREDVGDPNEAESIAELTQEQGQSVFDPTAGIGGDKDGPKINHGWHTTGRPGGYKDWAAYYLSEMEAYKADLAQEKNPTVAEHLKSLITLLNELATRVSETLELQKEVSVAPDPTKEEQLNKMKENLTLLKNKKSLLQQRIRRTQIEKQKQQLETDFQQERNPQEKEILKQQIALQALSLSTDLGKAKERNARLDLINSLVGKGPGKRNALPPHEFERKLQAITEASKARVPLGTYKKEWNKVDAKKLRELILSGTFDGLIEALLEKIISYKASAKKDIVNGIIADLQQAKMTELKPFKDAVDVARKSGNKEALDAAIKNLNNAMNKKAINDQAEVHPVIIEVANRSKAFRAVANEFRRLSQLPFDQESDKLIMANIEKLKTLIREAQGKQYSTAMLVAAHQVISHIEKGKTQ
jgi:hypothetical protein